MQTKYENLLRPLGKVDVRISLSHPAVVLALLCSGLKGVGPVKLQT